MNGMMVLSPVGEGGRVRDCHGYGKTHGFEVTGFVGTGTVVEFGTPRCDIDKLFLIKQKISG